MGKGEDYFKLQAKRNMYCKYTYFMKICIKNYVLEAKLMKKLLTCSIFDFQNLQCFSNIYPSQG